MRRIATARDLCKLAAYVNAGNDCAGFSASSEKVAGFKTVRRTAQSTATKPAAASSASTTDVLTETVLKKIFPRRALGGIFFV